MTHFVALPSAVVWFLVTTGWLLTLQFDRSSS
jgi:hypothetical protein